MFPSNSWDGFRVSGAVRHDESISELLLAKISELGRFYSFRFRPIFKSVCGRFLAFSQQYCDNSPMCGVTPMKVNSIDSLSKIEFKTHFVEKVGAFEQIWGWVSKLIPSSTVEKLAVLGFLCQFFFFGAQKQAWDAIILENLKFNEESTGPTFIVKSPLNSV